MADYSAQIRDLQDDFHRLAERAPWLRAVFKVNAGKCVYFGFRRPNEPGPAASLVSQSTEDYPIITESDALTDRAGKLFVALYKAGCYKWKPCLPAGVKCQPRVPWEFWLLSLLLTPQLSVNCWTQQSDGTAVFAPQLGEGKTAIWIDHYAGVCSAALAHLKAGMMVPSPSTSTPPPARGATKLAQAIALKRSRPDLTDKAVAEAVGCHPSTLSGSPEYRATRDALLADALRRWRRSRRNRGSEMDAYADERDE
jgi:hypothetical protein